MPRLKVLHSKAVACGRVRLTRLVSSDAHSAQASQSTSSSMSEEMLSHISIGTDSPNPPTALGPSIPSAVPITTKAMSTGAQPPTPSQNSANSGVSKRTVSNGEQVVLNSDSDTDSLLDIDWGESRTSFKVAAPTARLKRTADGDDDVLRKPEKKGKSGKQSFDILVQTAQQDMEIERKIQERKADLDKSIEEPKSSNITISEDSLGQIVEEDDDDPTRAHRLFLAMQRTDATQTDSVFHFFEDVPDSTHVRSSFPFSCLPQTRWTTSFRGASLCTIMGILLTCSRPNLARSGLFDWLCTPDIPSTGSSRGDCLLDARTESVVL